MMTPETKTNTHTTFLPIAAFLCAAAAIAATPTEAFAETDSLFALGASTRVAYQPEGSTSAVGDDYSLHLGLRGEMFYLFGAELEYTPVPDRIASDIYRPSLRLTGHLHLLNFESFDFYLGFGLAGDELSHLVDLEGSSTLYRGGAGLEISPGGHWAVGVDGYWSVAGLGHFNSRLSDALDEGEDVPDPRDQVKPGMIEIGLALRYYL